MVLGDGYGIGEGKLSVWEIIYYHIPRSGHLHTRLPGIHRWNCRLLETRKIQTAKNKPQLRWWRGWNKSTKMQQGLTLVLENIGVSSRSQANVRRFGCFTPDLIAIVKWMWGRHCSNGSNGCLLDSSLSNFESRGIEVKLVNAHHVKTVPGRKQIKDCQWLQQYLRLTVRFVPSWRPSVFYVVISVSETAHQNASTHAQRMQALISDEFAFT